MSEPSTQEESKHQEQQAIDFFNGHGEEARRANRRSSLLTTIEEQELLQRVDDLWKVEEEEEEDEFQAPLAPLPRKSLVRPGVRGKASESFRSAVRFSINCRDCSHVRRPKLYSIIKSHPVVDFKYRFANAQVNRTLLHPTLPQPRPRTTGTTPLRHEQKDNEHDCEMRQTRPSHRFVVTADTQFGILMDGFPMDDPNWKTEMDYSKMAVQKINAMRPKPLFVCVCGDLVDTEASFCSAIPTWKKIMKDWECHAVHLQQFQDWKDIWSEVDEDIALVCLCGNHDVGNRPTAKSIETFTSAFGSDYLAFWANGTYNIALNNCLFFDPTGAPELFDDQVDWLKERLEYATRNDATQIFVFGHFPWFLYHENEVDEDIDSASYPPKGWGAPGAAFSDSYFNIPLEYRKIALDLFKEHKVKACFSGHFHQNLLSKASWGMDMIITGPLSMILQSNRKKQQQQQLLENGGVSGEIEEPDALGMRVVDVDRDGFRHEFVLLEVDE